MMLLVEIQKHDLLVSAARALLDGKDPSEPLEAFRRLPSNNDLPFDIETSSGAVAIGNGGGAISTLEQLAPESSERFVVRAFINSNDPADIHKRLEGWRFYTDPPIAGLLTCGNSPSVGDSLRVQQELRAQRLWNSHLDGRRVAIAIVDTGISLRRLQQPLGSLPAIPPPHINIDIPNSWSPWTVTTRPFEHRVGHGTMCAYDALIAAPEATLLDMAMLLLRPLGEHGVRSTVFAAAAVYSVLANLWLDWLALGPSASYQALVVNNSWGIFHPFLDPFAPNDPHRYIDNPQHMLRTSFIIPMVTGGVDIVFASNNCGPECRSATCLGRSTGMIMGMNAYEEVLTVGGCDVNHDRVGYSSLGPSIAGMPQYKPDIAAYTHFLGSRGRRSFLPDTGVSAACAVASGCVAALRSRLPPTNPNYSPARLLKALKSTALKGNNSTTNGGTWNPAYGCGIINPVDAGINLGLNIPPVPTM
jgi:subtilisin family serine protease